MEAQNYEKVRKLATDITSLILQMPTLFADLTHDKESTPEVAKSNADKIMACAEFLISAGMKLTISKEEDNFDNNVNLNS